VDACLERVRARFHIPEDFPPEVLAEAEHLATRGPRAPEGRPVTDRTDLPLVTIDPDGSTDLDQAFTASRLGSGYRVHYAIVDLGSYVTPEGAIDTEARRRGVTIYAPDRRAPLHPPSLSEGAASLLANRDRAVLLWTLDLDAEGALVDHFVERAMVRSRAQLTYRGVQDALDAGTAEGALMLLREIGERCLNQEAARHGVSLDLPEQSVRPHDGGYVLEYEITLPVERWNAQISLLTGMTAAQMMLDARVGLLRTLPPPDAHTIDVLRTTAAALGVPWPASMSYPERMRTLDGHSARGAAMMHRAARIFRGAGYLVLDGSPPAWDKLVHAAIAAPYAHVTAPLRRLGDRFANEIVLAISAGRSVPEWVVAALPALPSALGAGQQRQSGLDRAVLDEVEVLVLEGRVGETFTAVVVDEDARGLTIQIAEPAVVARLTNGQGPPPPLGASITVRLAEIDSSAPSVHFDLAH
jgi:exoribonuclease R